jgi:CheY-like chemotaxis protein
LNLLTRLWSLRAAGMASSSEGSPRLGHPAEKLDASILVVEDDASSQQVARRLLDELGCRATVVASGAECLKLLQDMDFDGIFMDLQMPVMDGFETTRAIRELEDPRKRAIPIVALTAHAMGADRERALSMGMSGYVTKPVKATELSSAIKEWILDRERGARTG